jgi:hypothetical protein
MVRTMVGVDRGLLRRPLALPPPEGAGGATRPALD